MSTPVRSPLLVGRAAESRLLDAVLARVEAGGVGVLALGLLANAQAVLPAVALLAVAVATTLAWARRPDTRPVLGLLRVRPNAALLLDATPAGRTGASSGLAALGCTLGFTLGPALATLALGLGDPAAGAATLTPLAAVALLTAATIARPKR